VRVMDPELEPNREHHTSDPTRVLQVYFKVWLFASDGDCGNDLPFKRVEFKLILADNPNLGTQCGH
jgi:hypothetical protein